MSEPTWISKDLGPVDAYALAVAGGYSGTKEQWIAEIAGASTNASDAEAYAKGTRGGQTVASDDPAYHNNSKYYDEQAALEKASAQAAAATASAAYNTNLLAPVYDATATYAVGDHVIYSGGYYECISAISTAEAWTAAHWRQLTVGGEAADLKSAISELEYTKSDPWGQQGLSVNGVVENVGNAATLFKATPHYFEKDFTFYGVRSGYVFNVVEYNFDGSNYSFKKGTAVSNTEAKRFLPGYYKIGFSDRTGSSPNYYSMSEANRTAAIKPLFEIHFDIDKIVNEKIEEIENTIDLIPSGYMSKFQKGNIWDQQGINKNGEIQNVTNAASLYKSIPHQFENGFKFTSYAQNGYKFIIIKYNYTNSNYVWDYGVEIVGSGEIQFPAGYYKFSFFDNTGSSPNYYNMSIDDRSAIINPMFDIFTDAIAWERFTDDEKRITELEDTVNNKYFAKPFVICSFDWYSDSWQKYQIMHEVYGLDATFCLDAQTSDYNLTSGLTRTQFDTMLKNGWDVAFYGGVGTRGETEQTWTEYIKGIVDQKEAIAIFNPVMYNTPDNNNASYITSACKNNGFLLQRAFNSETGNYLKSTDQYNTGAIYLTNGNLQTCKDAVDTAIANGWGVVFYAHNMSDSSDLSVASFTSFCEYLAGKVSSGDIEVLSAREYVYKYLPEKAIQNDYEAQIKRYCYLHDVE